VASHVVLSPIELVSYIHKENKGRLFGEILFPFRAELLATSVLKTPWTESARELYRSSDSRLYDQSFKFFRVTITFFLAHAERPL
jgi:hypothetical protein